MHAAFRAMMLASLCASPALAAACAPASAPASAHELHVFQGSQTDGFAYAVQSLAADPNGLVFGATSCGTRYRAFPCAGYGAIFTLSRHSDHLSIIHSFDNFSDGYDPVNPIVVTPNDTVYGASNGGYSNEPRPYGLVWQLTPPAAVGDAWTYTIIHAFDITVDGANVAGGLAMDAKGDLFGQTVYTTEYGRGWVFELTPPAQGATIWGETLLHQFHNNQQTPVPVTLGRDGQHVYGLVVTHKGGIDRSLFQINNTSHGWVYDVVFSFPNTLTRFSNIVVDDHRDVFGYAETQGNQLNRTGRFYELSPPPAGETGWTYRDVFTFPESGPPTTVMGQIVLIDGTLVGEAYDDETGARLFRLDGVRGDAPRYTTIPVDGYEAGELGGGVFRGPPGKVLGMFYKPSSGTPKPGNDGFAYIEPLPSQ